MSVFLCLIYNAVNRIYWSHSCLTLGLYNELRFNATDSGKGFFKLCEDYGVSHDHMRYQNEKFFGTYQHGHWSDYIGPNSIAHWIIRKSQGFTDVGSHQTSESIRAYEYLILILLIPCKVAYHGQYSECITAQKAFLNNFESIVNCRVDIWEDIKCYQDTLGYTSSRVDYSVGEGI